MSTPRLVALSTEQGHSPWLDNLKRSYLTDGTLARFVERGVRGVTSNPTIFQKAIAGSSDYDAAFGDCIRRGLSVEDAYWELVRDDVAGACDALAPVHRATDGIDGYVSLEVSPNLAEDTVGTEVAARRLWDAVDRPNLMIKIPATRQGLPAIRSMIREGRSINVTLIFSLERYADVIEAYLAGLEDRLADGVEDLSDIASVASFFISRVDTEIDRRLEAIGTTDALALRGRAAVAQGVLAYQLALHHFSGPRWERLAAHGARSQRPLWASTSTKNPSYPDTLYVDTLIGPGSVNTLPEATLEAFADHGTPARTVDTVAAIVEADHVWRSLADIGVDVGDVARVLEAEGVSSFVKSFDELLSTLNQAAEEVAGGTR